MQTIKDNSFFESLVEFGKSVRGGDFLSCRILYKKEYGGHTKFEFVLDLNVSKSLNYKLKDFDVKINLTTDLTTTQGTQTFDLPPNLRRQSGRDKARKDSYSALVLANWMVKTYFDIMNFKPKEVEVTFTPRFIK